MIKYLKLYCKKKKYIIDSNSILSNNKVIGNIDYKEEIVTLGRDKYKYGDFAVAILNNYYDLYEGDENDNV